MRRLRELHLRVPRAKTLDPLRGHPNLEVVEIDFGGIRDLSPLAEIPGLRAVELYQIRLPDTHDLDALGGCRSLVGAAFRGETLWIRGKSLRGDPERANVDASWRGPVEQYLTLR